MKRILSIVLALVVLTLFCGSAFAESKGDNNTTNILNEIYALIDSATPEEQTEIKQRLFFHLLLSDSENSDSINVGNTRKTAKENNSNSKYFEFPIIFENENFEAYITAWESCNFIGGDIGYEFSFTVYNNSDVDYEFGVQNLKVNGWNIHDRYTYNSIIKIKAGEKARETWQISGIIEKTDITSLDEVEEITGLFFLGDYNSWADEIYTQDIIITRADLDKIRCKD